MVLLVFLVLLNLRAKLPNLFLNPLVISETESIKPLASSSDLSPLEDEVVVGDGRDIDDALSSPLLPVLLLTLIGLGSSLLFSS